MELFKKQEDFLNQVLDHKLKRINILHGAVRSGKTFISLAAWAIWVKSMPDDKSYLMVGKTITSLKRNCLDLLESMVGKANFKYSTSAKQGTLFGRTIYLEGVNDARSENKIRGMTLQGAYCDELTLFSEDFFVMLLSRLSEKGAKLIGTTNPDSPFHWLKEKYIDRENELDLQVISYSIFDNEFLDKDYVDNIIKEYTGVFYERFILGRWCIAQGLVYPMFDSICDEIPDGGEYYISIDYGTLNPCVFLLWKIVEGRAYLAKEFYYNGRENKQLSDEEYYKRLEEFANGYPVICVIIDPSAASFKATIREHGRFNVRDANNDVIDGIRRVCSYLNNKDIQVHRDCKNTINEFRVYAWDENSHEDKVIKENDHCMDALRYFANTIYRRMR